MPLSDTDKLRLINILLKVDSTGEHDFISVSDVSALIAEYKSR